MKQQTGLAVSILAASVLVLAACGGGDAANTETDTGSTQADENITLRFANFQWLEEGRGDLIWEVVESFTEEYPNVTIEKETISRPDYESTLSTQIGAGGGPDLFYIPDPYFFELLEADRLLPLDDVVDDSVRERLTSMNDLYEVDGVHYGLVWETAGYGFFYNKQLLADAGIEVPTTFEEVVAAAVSMTEQTGQPSIASRHMMNEEAAWWNDHMFWVYATGGELSKDGELTLNSPEVVAAETEFQKLVTSGAFAVGDDAATFREKFRTGEIPMLIDAAGVMVALTDDNPNLPPEQLGSAALPNPSPGTQFIGAAIGVNANSEHPEVVKDFIRWLYTPEIQAEIARGVFPSVVGTDIPVPEDRLAEHPWFESVHEQLSTNAVGPVVIEGYETETPQVRTIFLRHVEEILQGKDVQTALDEAQEEAQRLVDGP